MFRESLSRRLIGDLRQELGVHLGSQGGFRDLGWRRWDGRTEDVVEEPGAPLHGRALHLAGKLHEDAGLAQDAADACGSVQADLDKPRALRSWQPVQLGEAGIDERVIGSDEIGDGSAVRYEI